VLDESRRCWLGSGGVGWVLVELEESGWCWMNPDGVG
jgi:hypothetical protein